MQSKNALTFIELLVVVVLISILATFGVGQYKKVMEGTRQKDAINNLVLIKAAQKIYFAKYGKYYPESGTALIGDINTNLNLSIVPPANLSYQCETVLLPVKSFECKAINISSGLDCTITQNSGPVCAP